MPRSILPVLTACLLPSLAAAQDLTPTEAEILPRILDTLCIDIVDASNGCEQALLLTSENEADTADLVILSNTHSSGGGGAPLAVIRSVAYSGAWMGQMPRLRVSDAGVLVIDEEQVALGRNPWTQSISIAERGGTLAVIAHSYSTYDRPAGGGFSCLADFDQGVWQVSADRVDPESNETTYVAETDGLLDIPPPALTDWRFDRPLPAPCSEGLTDWFAASPL